MTEADSRLATAFERCIDALLDDGRTVKGCLTRWPQHAEALRPLLTTVAHLDLRHAVPGPPADGNARTRFLVSIRS